jgi:replicative DNA helicase
MNAYNSDSAKYDRLKKIEAQQEAQGLSDYIFGKVQPQALQLEEAVLGALMLDKDSFETVNDILQAESFYTEAHQAIFRAISELIKGFKPVDLLTVTEQLRKMDAIEIIGGSYHLVELTNRVGSAANIEYHARIIQQKHIAREKIKASTQTIRECYDESLDIFDVIEKDAQRSNDIDNIASQSIIEVDLNKAADELEKMVEYAQKGGLLGVTSGLMEVDKILNGSREGRLELIAARPAMGKTGYMCQEILALAEAGLPVVVGSIEMTAVELLGRLATAKSGIENDKLEGKRQLTTEEYQKWKDTLRYITTLPIHINDSSTQSVRSLRAFARRIIKKYEALNGKFVPTEIRKCAIAKILVDYIQIMESDSENANLIREQQVSRMVRGLKSMAKSLRVPVGALAQVNRAVETRGGTKIPTLADLRESGSIEQECDIVSFLYRPEYYNIIEDENGHTTLNKLQFIVAKHRGGALGTANLYYDRTTQKIQDWNNFYQSQSANNPQNNIIARPQYIEDLTDTPKMPKGDTDTDLPF